MPIEEKIRIVFADMKKPVLLAAGFLCTGIGIAGIFLPVVPTTGPLLLAAWFFARSSKRFYTWLVEHRLFGRYIRSFIKYKAITLKGKIFSLVAMWGMIGVSGMFFVDSLAVRIILGACAVGGTALILRYPTLKRSDNEAADEKPIEEARIPR